MFEGKLRKFVIMMAVGEKKGYNHFEEFEENGVDHDTYVEEGRVVLHEGQAANKMRDARKHLATASHHDTGLSMDALLAMGNAMEQIEGNASSDEGAGEHGAEDDTSDDDDGLGGGTSSLLAAMGVGVKKTKAVKTLPKVKAKATSKARSLAVAGGGAGVVMTMDLMNARASGMDDDDKRRRGRPSKVRSVQEVSESLVQAEAALCSELADIITDR